MDTNARPLAFFSDDHYPDRTNRPPLIAFADGRGFIWMARLAGLSRQRAILFAEGLPRSWFGDIPPCDLVDPEQWKSAVATLVQALRAFKGGDTAEYRRCCQILCEISREV